MSDTLSEVVAVVANMVESALEVGRAMIGAQRKITSSHLQRLAVVYLRHSTPAQVRLNVGSTDRQYAIAGEAARLGWQSERIVVVDGDLGVSGRDTHARESYNQLVARCVWARSARSWGWRSRGWRATTRTSCGCLSSAR